jgi:hypothetical protein
MGSLKSARSVAASAPDTVFQGLSSTYVDPSEPHCTSIGAERSALCQPGVTSGFDAGDPPSVATARAATSRVRTRVEPL